jgi:hypothetical protein
MLITSPIFNTNSAVSLVTQPLVSVVGQGSTYLITSQISTLGSWYSDLEVMAIRLILPNTFSSLNPMCSIAKLSNGATST